MYTAAEQTVEMLDQIIPVFGLLKNFTKVKTNRRWIGFESLSITSIVLIMKE